MRQQVSFVVVSLVSILTSCSADSIPATPKRVCEAEGTQSLIGKPKPTDVEAMRITGSNIVRQIAPGQMVTHDYRNDRVTIESDPVSGRVVVARCG